MPVSKVQDKPKQASKVNEKPKTVAKPKATTEDSDIEEDFIDYDEEFLDESVDDKVKDQFKIGQSKPVKEDQKKNSIPTKEEQKKASMPAKEEQKKASKPSEMKQSNIVSTLQQSEQPKPANNKFLNQFHTVKKSEPSEEIEDSIDESEPDEEEDKALVETLIRLYNNDPESLGEFERELVEKELKSRDPKFKPKTSPASISSIKDTKKSVPESNQVRTSQNSLKTESVERKLDSVIGNKSPEKIKQPEKAKEIKQPEESKKTKQPDKTKEVKQPEKQAEIKKPDIKADSDKKSIVSEKKSTIVDKKSVVDDTKLMKEEKKSTTEEKKKGNFERKTVFIEKKAEIKDKKPENRNIIQTNSIVNPNSQPSSVKAKSCPACAECISNDRKNNSKSSSRGRDNKFDTTFKAFVNNIYERGYIKPKKKRATSKIMQEPMIFDLDDPSEKSDEYIFGKPTWLSTVNKKLKKRKRANRNREINDKNVTNKEIKSRKASAIDVKEQYRKESNKRERPRTAVNVKRANQTSYEINEQILDKSSKPQKKSNQVNIKVENAKKESKSKKQTGKGTSKKIDFYPKEKHNDEGDEIIDDGIMILKLSKKGNEYIKPGSKNTKKEQTNSYTDKVLQKLDNIKNPKGKALDRTSGNTLHKTEKLDLEGLELKGLEIIKDLDEYYEKNKHAIVNKVMKSKKFRDFAKTHFTNNEIDDFNVFKREITKHVIKDLEKYCAIR